jgi:uncharacterized protein
VEKTGVIVINTSPLINFAVIGQLALLHDIFGKLTIPAAVLQELARRQQRYPDVLSTVQQSGFIDVFDVRETALRDILLIDLDPGEAEVIALAVERKAKLVILDELAGRHVAEAQGLLFTGSVGCLVEAKRLTLITEIRPYLDAMRDQAGFWLREAVYQRILQDQGESKG